MMQQKKDSSRIHKVISDYGVKDYYRSYHRTHKGTKNDLDLKKYSMILDDVLKGIADAMSHQMYDFKLPYSLGRIITRKYHPAVYYDEDGEPKIKRGINWPETRKMWEEYPELYKKQFVYFTNQHSNGYTFTIIYRKRGCMFHNRLYYTAQVNRAIKREIAKKILAGEFDSLETRTK